MFGDRYFGPRYYGNRYFGEGGTGTPEPSNPADDDFSLQSTRHRMHFGFRIIIFFLLLSF